MRKKIEGSIQNTDTYVQKRGNITFMLLVRSINYHVFGLASHLLASLSRLHSSPSHLPTFLSVCLYKSLCNCTYIEKFHKYLLKN